MWVQIRAKMLMFNCMLVELELLVWKSFGGHGDNSMIQMLKTTKHSFIILPTYCSCAASVKNACKKDMDSLNYLRFTFMIPFQSFSSHILEAFLFFPQSSTDAVAEGAGRQPQLFPWAQQAEIIQLPSSLLPSHTDNHTPSAPILLYNIFKKVLPADASLYCNIGEGGCLLENFLSSTCIALWPF